MHVAPVLTEYLGRLMHAGYDEQYRRRTLENAIRVYDKMKEDDRNGEKPLNRPKDWQLAERRKEKRKKKHG